MVDEVMVSGYRKEISDHNITNTHDPKKINVAGEIKWLDNDEKNRPDSITIKLIKNDEVLETKKVTKNNKWKYTFINLYKYEKGKEIEYKIKEDIVPNYEQNVS